MWKRRIAWLAILLAALGMYLLENNAGTRIVLIAVIVLPICSALTLLPKPKVTVQLAVPETLSRGAPAQCKLVFTNSSPLPLPSVRCVLEVQNLLTGETSTSPVSVSVGGKKTTEVDLVFSSAHCGKVAVRCFYLRILDPFSLFARMVLSIAMESVLILPTVSPVDISLADAAELLQDSETYSTQRPGYDPSETFRIREYIPGDPIRQIHWKLSQKTDAPLVRDFGLPVVNELLILLETTSIPGGTVSPQDMDDMLDLLFSLSQALVMADRPYAVGWQDALSGRYMEREITSPEDLSELRELLLSNSIHSSEITVAGCYAMDHPQCAFGHVVVISSYAAPDLDLLYQGNRVSLLCPHQGDTAIPAEADTVSIIPFTAAELQSGTTHFEF